MTFLSSSATRHACTEPYPDLHAPWGLAAASWYAVWPQGAGYVCQACLDTLVGEFGDRQVLREAA